MGDSSNSDNSKSAIPSWQNKTASSDELQKLLTNDARPAAPTQNSTVETAKKFLDDENIRNASRDEKIIFLQSKGLDSNTIQQLLGAYEDTTTRSSGQPTGTDSIVHSPSASQISPGSRPGQAAISSPTTSSSPRQVAHQYTAGQNIPPIITYPEFLTIPQRPAPRVTASRLLTTLYLFGGISALLYGTSNYIIAPLLETMTESRHSLAETAQSNISKLITKLEAIVSIVPLETGVKNLPASPGEDESDSDPTEMFHRDIGIQTSLPPSPTQTRPSSPPPVESAIDSQAMRLAALTTHLKDLSACSNSEGEDYTELTTTLDVVRDYIQSLAFVQPTYNYGTYLGGGVEKDENDEISKVKAQIRGVKGVLLSAKSFGRVTR